MLEDFDSSADADMDCVECVELDERVLFRARSLVTASPRRYRFVNSLTGALAAAAAVAIAWVGFQMGGRFVSVETIGTQPTSEASLTFGLVGEDQSNDANDATDALELATRLVLGIGLEITQ